MAKFRCIASGNIVEFTYQHDIDSMVGHSGYERLDEEGNAVVTPEVENNTIPFGAPLGAPLVVKPSRGRPRKTA